MSELAALRSQKPRIMGRPEMGLFKMRLVKAGPWVPARIWRQCHCTIGGGDENAAHDWTPACDRYPPLLGEINGKICDPDRVWNSRSLPIDEAEFCYLVDLRRWAEQTPSAPEHNPRAPIVQDQIPLF